MLVIFVQTQLSLLLSLAPCPSVLPSLSLPSGFSPRLCCFFCFPVSVSHCLSVCLPLPLPLWSAVSSSRGRELRGQGKSRGQRREGHGFWQPTEISPLSFPPPLSMHSRMNRTSLFPFPVISVVSTSQFLPGHQLKLSSFLHPMTVLCNEWVTPLHCYGS